MSGERNAPPEHHVRELVNRGQNKNRNVNELTAEQINLLINCIFLFLNDLHKIILEGNKKLPFEYTSPNQFPEPKVIISCVDKLLSQLNGHVDEFGLCHESIDSFKIAAWLGVFLIHETRNSSNQVAEQDIVATLAYELEMGNGRRLGRDLRELITDMLKNDKLKDDHAVGMNGLYLIFRSAAKVEILSDRDV